MEFNTVTREAALQKYFESFGLKAFPATSEPKDIEFPWLTYETSAGNWGDEVSIVVKLWFHTDSEAEPNAKVRQISESIGLGGKVINYDDGKMWLRRGSPWCNSIPNDTDTAVKCKALNIMIEDWRI